MADEDTSIVAGQMLGELCTSVELESSRQNTPVSDLDYGDDMDLLPYGDEKQKEQQQQPPMPETNHEKCNGLIPGTIQDLVNSVSEDQGNNNNNNSYYSTISSISNNLTNDTHNNNNNNNNKSNNNNIETDYTHDDGNKDTVDGTIHAMGNGFDHTSNQGEKDDEAVIDEIMEDAVEFADNCKDIDVIMEPNQPNGNMIHRDDSGEETTEVISSQKEENSQPSETNQDDEEYVVERVIEKKLDSRGFARYLVKWKSYPHSDNTWEPLESLIGCEQVMIDFECRSAEKLAERHATEEDNHSHHHHHSRSNGTKPATSQVAIKRKQTASRKRSNAPEPKEFEVNDVMGLTMVDGERYFLISLANSTQKKFMRASLANKVIPSKVIDFYIKSMKWKSSAGSAGLGS